MAKEAELYYKNQVRLKHVHAHTRTHAHKYTQCMPNICDRNNKRISCVVG